MRRLAMQLDFELQNYRGLFQQIFHILQHLVELHGHAIIAFQDRGREARGQNGYRFLTMQQDKLSGLRQCERLVADEIHGYHGHARSINELR